MTQEIENDILSSHAVSVTLGKYGVSLELTDMLINKFYKDTSVQPYSKYQEDVVNYLKSLSKVEKLLLDMKF